MLQLWFGWYMEGGYCIYCFVLTGLLNNASLFIFCVRRLRRAAAGLKFLYKFSVRLRKGRSGIWCIILLLFFFVG